MLKLHNVIINFKDVSFNILNETIPSGLVNYRSKSAECESGCHGLKLCSVNSGNSNAGTNNGLSEMITAESNSAKSENPDSSVGVFTLGGERTESSGMESREDMTLSDEPEYIEKSVAIEDQIILYVEKLNGLNHTEKAEILKLLLKYREVFSDQPGCTRTYENEIKPTSDKPFVKKSYPIPLYQQSAVDRDIHKMLRQGIIEYSCSEYCNPIRIVAKKNGEIRVCLDARFLNKFIPADNECRPHTDELMQKHEGAKYFSITDLVRVYYQFRLKKESRKYTTFRHKRHTHQFT